ncbi:Cullin-4B [Smittium culicis]|uniref:Cullin-4B n=1 Tax=Smittium culicis TaxID=133412 RepID=A0A1R1YGW2_9FUNG|nr:Cullin-4B [Smittium culicis]
MDNILTKCFFDNEKFNHTLTEAFEFIINSQQSRLAKLISKHLDEKLKSKHINGPDIEKSFDEVMKLFRFLDSKLSFEIYYKSDMSKRLLSSKSFSKESEMLLLMKLRTGKII